MKKSLIIGLAALAVTGSALISNNIFASSTGSALPAERHAQMATSLSGTVSAEALTALQSLMTQHQTEMNTLRSNSGTTHAQRTAKRTEHQAAMEALKTKYPELKIALKSLKKAEGKNNRKSGSHGQKDEVKAVIATLPASVQTELQTIRDSYQTRHEALRTEEKAKVDVILAQYPTVRAKLDALRPVDGGQGRDGR